MPIRCRPWWTALLVAAGMPPRAAYVELGSTRIRVRMGIGFRAEFPRACVRAPRRLRNKVSIGVHGWRGGWLVNGARGPLVGFTLDPPGRARVYGIPVKLRELVVSVDDPQRLIAQLSAAPEAAA